MLQVGDILLVSGDTFAAKTIQEITDSKWNHTALYIGNGQVLEINWNLPSSIVPNPYMENEAGTEVLVLRSKKKITSSQKTRIQCSARFYNQFKFKYDWLLICALLLKRVFPKWKWLRHLNEKLAFICTELVVQVLREARVLLFPNRGGDIYPYEFLQCKDLEIIKINRIIENG